MQEPTERSVLEARTSRGRGWLDDELTSAVVAANGAGFVSFKHGQKLAGP